jgi:uncharacterized membrane protein (DUF4010 family)
VAAAALVAWVVLKFAPPTFMLRDKRLRPVLMNTLVVTACAALAYLAYSQDVGWGLPDVAVRSASGNSDATTP